jgi:hypothetical protein
MTDYTSCKAELPDGGSCARYSGHNGDHRPTLNRDKTLAYKALSSEEQAAVKAEQAAKAAKAAEARAAKKPPTREMGSGAVERVKSTKATPQVTPA